MYQIAFSAGPERQLTSSATTTPPSRLRPGAGDPTMEESDHGRQKPMKDQSGVLTSWVLFGGFVLIVAVLYWAQAVLMPVAVAVLLTFLLSPAVSWLQRWVHRGLAIIATVIMAFTLLGAASWGVAHQLSGLVEDLPTYRDNIRQKVADIRGASQGSSMEKVQDTLEEIQTEIEGPDEAAGTPARPVVVQPAPVSGLWSFPAWIGPLVEPLATAGLVIALVIFMLIERQDLRDRLIGLIGHGHITVTTRAFDEAATRVSRYLLMQSLVNATYGVGVAVGLYLIGVPYYLLWAVLGALLRFIPYVGPLAGAGAPILVSLAALPGWMQPLSVVGLFVGLELFTNLVLETFLYAEAAGVSQVALLVAVAFWTWLWGAMGLLLATPLTVCLVVIGKHVPGLKFVATLLADSPALTPEVGYYQRLLARDQSEAAEIIERHVKTEDPWSVFDALMLPALNAAERDRLDGRLSQDEETAVVEATRELIPEAMALIHEEHARQRGEEEREPQSPPATRLPVLAYAANAEADVLSVLMLEQLLADTPVALKITSARKLPSELVSMVVDHKCRIVCIADLPPSPPSKSRYLIKKLRVAMPDLKIVVGRWAPPELADESVAPLVEAGADYVGTTLVATRDRLRQIVQQIRLADEAAATPPPSDTPVEQMVPSTRTS